MKKHSLLNAVILILIWLPIRNSHADSTNATVTTIANLSQGGTITGAGIYATGTVVNVQIQANDGWYLSNVTYDGPPGPLVNGQYRLNPSESWQKMMLINYQLGQNNPGGFDPTTITSFAPQIYLLTNCTVTAWFTVLSPTIIQPPTNQIAVTGGNATLTSGANGRQPIKYQWQKGVQNMLGQTNANLVFNNVQLTNAGTYTLVASNSFGMTNSLPINLIVQDFVVLTNGQPASGSPATVVGQVTIGLQSLFSGGAIFYTLDGSQPDFGGTPYTGAFDVSTTSTLRAIAYSSDFSQSVLSSPLNIIVIPTFYLFTYAPGGGSIVLNPANQPYASNSVVTVIALPDSGWTFMGWSGDATGTNLTNSITMNSDKNVQAVFGTMLSTTVAGNGTVLAYPIAPLYSYGSTVQITPVPNPGNYFGLWGNAASGSQNPLYFTLTTANPTVSSLFAALPVNQVALTIIYGAGGYVTVNPSANKYTVGNTNVLMAIPNIGQQFVGWSGDVSSTTNPLSLVMDTSKVITANFTGLNLASSQKGTNMVFTWPTNSTEDFVLQFSSNLGQSAVWNTVIPSPVVVGGSYVVTNSMSGTSGFFRLMYPW